MPGLRRFTGFVGNLSIRDFPDDVQRRIRLAAVENDESMKAFIIRACEHELARHQAERERQQRRR
jgi:hypothetical protein